MKYDPKKFPWHFALTMGKGSRVVEVGRNQPKIVWVAVKFFSSDFSTLFSQIFLIRVNTFFRGALRRAKKCRVIMERFFFAT